METNPKVILAIEARDHIVRTLTKVPPLASNDLVVRMELPLGYLRVIGGVMEAVLRKYHERKLEELN